MDSLGARKSKMNASVCPSCQSVIRRGEQERSFWSLRGNNLMVLMWGGCSDCKAMTRRVLSLV